METSIDARVQAIEGWLAGMASYGEEVRACEAAARAVNGSRWDVIAAAGPLARGTALRATRSLGLTMDLRPCPLSSNSCVATVAEGDVYPGMHRAGRRKRGAWDTPPEWARAVVRRGMRARGGTVGSALDPACGTGVFLAALAEEGVGSITGKDLDARALAVARVAVPEARLLQADGMAEGMCVDLVVGNPPFVAPEHQDKASRRRLVEQFPWLTGRFDLAVPFAFSASEHMAEDGVLAMVLPASLLTQNYAEPLRRRWLRTHRIHWLGAPQPFPGAAVDVVMAVLKQGGAPGTVGPRGPRSGEVLALERAPLDPCIRSEDIAIVQRIRARSERLGLHANVDTGLVAHLPGGTREDLVFAEPGENRVPYADAREFFAGKRRWLHYEPSRMHRAKRPALFESPKVVVQRVRGRRAVPRAAVDRSGCYLGHTCNLVVTRGVTPTLEQVVDLVTSRLAMAVLRVEYGRRVDIYPKDLAGLPVPKPWLGGEAIPLEEAWGLTATEVDRLLELASDGAGEVRC